MADRPDVRYTTGTATTAGKTIEWTMNGVYNVLTVGVVPSTAWDSTGVVTYTARTALGEWVPLVGTNRASRATATSGTFTASSYNNLDFNITNIEKVRITVGATTGGTIDFYGNAVMADLETVTAVLSSGTAAIGTVDTELPAAAAFSDTQSNPTAPIVGSAMMAWNDGTTYLERLRNNMTGTLLASTSRTATVSSADQTNYNARGVVIFFSQSSGQTSTSAALTLTINGKDPVASGYVGINTATASTAFCTAASQTLAWIVYPGTTHASGTGDGTVIQSTPSPLPRTWRVTVGHPTTGSFAYAVGYSYIV